MKKIILATVLTLSILVALALPSSANETLTSQPTVDEDGNTIYYYDDGSYTVVSPVKALSSTTRAATHSIIGTVSAENYSKSNELNWVYTLYGYFTYEEGVSCVCTNSTFDAKIYKSGWKYYDPSNTWSENAAYGYIVFKHKVLFVTNSNVVVDLRVRCDNYGNMY